MALSSSISKVKRITLILILFRSLQEDGGQLVQVGHLIVHAEILQSRIPIRAIALNTVSFWRTMNWITLSALSAFAFQHRK